MTCPDFFDECETIYLNLKLLLIKLVVINTLIYWTFFLLYVQFLYE